MNKADYEVYMVHLTSAIDTYKRERTIGSLIKVAVFIGKTEAYKSSLKPWEKERLEKFSKWFEQEVEIFGECEL